MEELIEKRPYDSKEALEECEKRHHLLFEFASELILIFDTNCNILESNPFALKNLGYSKEEMAGQPISDFFTSDSKKIFADRLPILLKKGFNRLELEIVRKDGKIMTVDCSTSAVYNEKGEISFFVTFQRDITDHKFAEEVMKKSEEKYRDIIETSPNIIFREYSKGNLFFANDIFTEILGYNREEIAKLNVFSLVHPGDLKKVKENIFPLFNGERVYNVKCRLKHKNGAYIPFSIDFSPIFNSEGNPVSIVGIAKNRTDYKRPEKIIQKRSREIESWNKFVGIKDRGMIEFKKETNKILNKIGENKIFEA